MRHLPSLAILAVGAAVTLAACGGGGASSGTGGAVAGTSGGALPGPGAAGPAAGGSAGGGSGAVHSAGGTAAPSSPGGPILPSGPDVVETATVTVGVKAVRAVAGDVARLSAVATGAGGYVESSSVRRGRAASATMSLRVPDDRLAGTLAAAEAVGRVYAVSEQGTDVTGRFVDLGVEERDLQAEEAAVRNILSRATKVADVLTIQEELFGIRQQADEVAATRSALAGQVAYATVAVTLTASPAPPARKARPGVLTRAGHLAARNLVAAVDAVVLAVGWSAPLLVLVAVAVPAALAVRRWRRRVNARAA